MSTEITARTLWHRAAPHILQYAQCPRQFEAMKAKSALDNCRSLRVSWCTSHGQSSRNTLKSVRALRAKAAKSPYGCRFRLGPYRVVMPCSPIGQQAFFRAKEAQLDQSSMYKFTISVFGRGVVFDVPACRRNQQIKCLVRGLSARSLESMVPSMCPGARLRRHALGYRRDRELAITVCGSHHRHCKYGVDGSGRSRRTRRRDRGNLPAVGRWPDSAVHRLPLGSDTCACHARCGSRAHGLSLRAAAPSPPWRSDSARRFSANTHRLSFGRRRARADRR